MRRPLIVAPLAALGVLALTGCSSVSTNPDQEALHYSGGPLSSRKFQDCVSPSKRDVNGPGDKYYAYPTRQVTYDVTGDKTAEAAPVKVVSKDNAELNFPATVTFTLTTDCQSLRKFHETLGNRYHAWTGGSDVLEDSNKNDIPDGWENLLNFAIGKPFSASLARTAGGYGWRELWNDPALVTQIQSQVKSELAGLVNAQAGGEFFTVDTVLIQRPQVVDESLKKAVADQQAAVAQKQTALAQVDVAKAQAESVQAQIQAWGSDYIRKYAIDNGVNPWPSPVVAGSAQGK